MERVVGWRLRIGGRFDRQQQGRQQRAGEPDGAQRGPGRGGSPQEAGGEQQQGGSHPDDIRQIPEVVRGIPEVEARERVTRRHRKERMPRPDQLGLAGDEPGGLRQPPHGKRGLVRKPGQDHGADVAGDRIALGDDPYPDGDRPKPHGGPAEAAGRAGAAETSGPLQCVRQNEGSVEQQPRQRQPVSPPEHVSERGQTRQQQRLLQEHALALVKMESGEDLHPLQPG